ncbi:MAG: hypothetical protein ACT4OH_02015 [Methylophilaceae bacterium]
MSIRSYVLLLCSAILALGCGSNPVIPKDTATNNNVTLITSKQTHVEELLYFLDIYANLAPEAQKKVLAETNQQLATNPHDLPNRIKLAAMLSLPSSRMRDSAKAQNLLQAMLQENSLSAADATLVGLLHEYTLDDAKQLQKLRDEAKKNEVIQHKTEILQQKIEALQQKNDALAQKLNDLKNIEKKIQERNTKTDGSSP